MKYFYLATNFTNGDENVFAVKRAKGTKIHYSLKNTYKEDSLAWYILTRSSYCKLFIDKDLFAHLQAAPGLSIMAVKQLALKRSGRENTILLLFRIADVLLRIFGPGMYVIGKKYFFFLTGVCSCDM